MNANISQTNSSSAPSLGIRGRLFIGFGLITLIFLSAIIISLFFVTTTKKFAEQVINTNLPTYDKLLDLNGQIYQTQAAVRGSLLTNDPAFKNELNVAWNSIGQITLGLDELAKNWHNTELVQRWKETKSLLDSLKQAQYKIENNSVSAGNNTDKQALITEINNLTNKVFDALDGPARATGERVGGLYDAFYQQLQKGSQKIIDDMHTLQMLEILLSILGTIVAIVIALFTARSILRHINIFRQYSNKVASGDLRHYLSIESNDEIGQLGNDLNVMTKSLGTITKQITEACHNMVSMLEEVKQAVDVQSSGATEQASSINEITASIEEIEKSSAQTMEKAKVLGEVAERTREKGQLGLDAVDQSIHGMKAVRDKVQMIAQTILDLSNLTQQVGEITSLVNSLAQQSKMLALNASIEAAKAGEAGKGFAVVAAEVKNLAEQSEQSTTQVQKILEDIRHATEKAVMVTEEGTKGVDHGANLVEQTGEIVRSLTDVIHETTMASQQIEAAVRQESVGIEQITVGMNEINQVTNSFVASAKQTIEAINNLAIIAKNLKGYIDTYKI